MAYELEREGLNSLPAIEGGEGLSETARFPVPLDQDMALHLERFQTQVQTLQEQFPNDLITSLPTEEKVVALTFDDGPDASTKAIVEILNNYGVHASFFLTGEKIEKHADVVEAIINSGHAISNHSWTHNQLLKTSAEDLLDEVLRTHKRLAAYAETPKLFRPPYGLVTEKQMRAITEEGFRVIVWSIDSLDWHLHEPMDIVACVVERIHPGAIVLMHSGGSLKTRQPTIQALPFILERLQALGYRFVTLNEL